MSPQFQKTRTNVVRGLGRGVLTAPLAPKEGELGGGRAPGAENVENTCNKLKKRVTNYKQWTERHKKRGPWDGLKTFQKPNNKTIKMSPKKPENNAHGVFD